MNKLFAIPGLVLGTLLLSVSISAAPAPAAAAPKYLNADEPRPAPAQSLPGVTRPAEEAAPAAAPPRATSSAPT